MEDGAAVGDGYRAAFLNKLDEASDIEINWNDKEHEVLTDCLGRQSFNTNERKLIDVLILKYSRRLQF